VSHFSRKSEESPRVYGHRGTRLGAPENTLGAMRLAIAQGADGIELDVRLCASGEPVVIHDPSLARVSGLSLVVAETPFATIRTITLGEGERVPLLDEALALVLGEGCTLNIELKADAPNLDALVHAVVQRVRRRSADEQQRVLFSSFSPAICELITSAEPASLIALIADQPPAALPHGCSAVHLHYGCAEAGLIADYKRAGLIVNSWTVNEAGVADVLARSGIDGIITDNVPMIRAHIE